MLGMGMTLSVDDLLDALSMPKEVLTGFFLQYSVSTTSSLGSILSKLESQDSLKKKFQ
jgi:BASS family bile acid:Na+ symporter